MSGKRYAVLIGNASFPGEAPGDPPRLPPLRCPPADVGGLREILEANRYGGYVVTSLIDRPHNEAQRAVYECLKNAGQDDQVLIYYSGHGKLDLAGNLYLAGRDTDPAALDPTAFAAANLNVIESQAVARFVILDCCFSGAIERSFLRGASKGEIADQAAQVVRGLEGRGIFYLTASTDMQTAEEKDHDRYSLLTKHIIDGIRDGKADADDDGQIGFSELCRYVQEKIRPEGTQRPISFTLRGYGDPAIALTGRAAFAAKRDAIEREIYALRQQNMLDGDDVRRILEHIWQPPPGRDAASNGQSLIEVLYAARSDPPRFQKILHGSILNPGERPQEAGKMSRTLMEPQPAEGREKSSGREAKPSPRLLVPLRLTGKNRAVWITLSLTATTLCIIATIWVTQRDHQPPEVAQTRPLASVETPPLVNPAPPLVHSAPPLVRPAPSLVNPGVNLTR